MANDGFGTSKRDREHGTLVDFRNIYASGNPTALHEALAFCSEKKIPLPQWLREELQRILKNYFSGETDNTAGRLARQTEKFRQRLANQVRLEAYRSVRRWQKDITRYDDMPTKAIDKWFRGKISPVPRTEKAARKIACDGLLGTGFHCEDRTLSDLIRVNRSDHKHTPPAPDLSKSPETTTRKSGYYSDDEHANAHMLFGHWPSEVEYGLRNPVQIFGPDREPPDCIRELLEEARKEKKSNLFDIG